MTTLRSTRSRLLVPLAVAAITLGALLPGLPAQAVVSTTAKVATSPRPAPRPKNLEATGRALVTEFLTILQRSDEKALAKFLDPAFLLQRADGSGADRSEYLRQPATVTSFVIPEGLQVEQNDDVLTVRWSLEVDEVIDGVPADTAAAPRLSAFHWSGTRWRLVAHANFNLPS